MNRKYSIGFIIGAIIAIALFLIAYTISYNQTLRHKESQVKKENQVEQPMELCYYISEKAGYVAVFEADKETVYEYTSIPFKDLPKALQEDVRNGLKVTSLREVYAFLENYSS